LARLAFLGLGQMGAPMAGRLLEAGHDLAVWNRTAAKADPLVERGARRGRSPAQAADRAEGVFTMLADPSALKEVVLGLEGAAGTMEGGATLIEMSTVGPEAVQAMAERLPSGVAMLDAPVLGSVPQAGDGSLKVFVGGADDDFARWRDVLSALGTPIHVGPLGAGASMKLVVNSALGALMTALGEALALADGLGIEQQQAFDVLAASQIGVTAKSKRDRIEAGSYPPNFRLALASKDLRLVEDAARRAGIELRVAPAARSWIDEAAARGLEDLDYSAVVAHIRGRPAGP
jgi:3-hydroxyisobutyrate dehydrogenase-like beta-hydroxyacid dehydrogenase